MIPYSHSRLFLLAVLFLAIGGFFVLLADSDNHLTGNFFKISWLSSTPSQTTAQSSNSGVEARLSALEAKDSAQDARLAALESKSGIVPPAPPHQQVCSCRALLDRAMNPLYSEDREKAARECPNHNTQADCASTSFGQYACNWGCY